MGLLNGSGPHASRIYASEADVLNMALFGQTAKRWCAANPGDKGNIRDQANASQLAPSNPEEQRNRK